MSKKPNIVVLMSDQMSYEVMKEGGQIKMPNMEKLKKDSLSCSRAYTVNAICSPSRASLMTGVLPHRHGMVDVTHAVPPYRAEYDYSLDTFSKSLQENGYHCGYFGKWHVERKHCLDEFGYDEWITEKEIPKQNITPIKRCVLKGINGYPDRVMGGVYSEGIEASEEYYCYSKAIDFIERSKSIDNPFMAFVSTYAPHDPYTVPQSIYDIYKDQDIELPQSYHDTCEDKPRIYQRLKEVWKDVSQEEAKEIKKYYNSYCSLVDNQIGRMIEYLKDNDLYENTVIIVLSDHGDLQGAHGLFCKGVGAFEEEYHIPLIIKFPYERVKGNYEGLVTMCDIAPTLLDIVNSRPLNGEIHGSSLIPAIKGERRRREIALAEFFGQRYGITQRILWKDNRKYVFNGFDYDEYYDLQSDPFEERNLIGNEAYKDDVMELCEDMQKEILKTKDQTMNEATYVTLRFAPVGPLKNEDLNTDYDVYNKRF